MNYFSSTYINSSIAQLATRYVGQYLDGIEPEKFEVAWKGGNLQLNDVRIRQEVVDLTGLPITLVYGWVGNVKVSLPIGNLLSIRAAAPSQPLIIELEELYLVLAPKPEAEWQESVFLERYRLTRQRLIDEVDVKLLAAQAQKQLETTAKQQQGWMARMASRLVEDIRFNIRSVHIRYEDSVGGGSSGPFCFGITLESLLIRTPTHEDLQALATRNKRDGTGVLQKSNTDDAAIIGVGGDGQKKLLRISGIAVYWNSNCKGPLLTQRLEDGPESVTLEQQNLIKLSMHDILLFARPASTPSQPKLPSYVSIPPQMPPPAPTVGPQTYILKPFSFSILVDINAVFRAETPPAWRKPQLHTFLNAEPNTAPEIVELLEPPSTATNRSTEKISQYTLRVDLASIDVSFSKNAFSDLSFVTTNISLYKSLAANVASRFELCLPYRPDLPIRGHARIWWKYAVGCIVRRLRQEFPYAFSEGGSIWTWGDNLKEARIENWKTDYSELLKRYFRDSAELSEKGMKPPSLSELHLRKEITYYQEVLPKKELLATYVETRQAFLGVSAQRGAVTPLIQAEKQTWGQWLGLTKKQQERPLEEIFSNPSDQIDELPSSEPGNEVYGASNEEFYDAVEESESRLPESIQGATAQQPVTLEAFEEFEEAEEINSETLMLKPAADSNQQLSKDLIDTLLATESSVIEVLVGLESASIELVTSSNARLTGSIDRLNVGLRIDRALTAKIALNDLNMRYEGYGFPTQRILTRQDAHEKQLLVMYFCTKEPTFCVPTLFVDVQHVTISFLPTVLGAAVSFLKVSDESAQSNGNALTKPNMSTRGQASQLVTSERLSIAKRLLYDEYRNALIDLFIAAPTIIIPTNSQENAQHRFPVLVAHLGSLTIASKKTPLPPSEADPFHPGRIHSYTSLQRFGVQLSEIHVDHFRTYDQAISRRHKGFSVIDRFALSVQLDFFVTQDKNVLKALVAQPKESPNASTTEEQLAPTTGVPKAGVNLRGDLPELAIYFNRDIFDSLLAAIRIVCAPLPHPAEDSPHLYPPIGGKFYAESSDLVEESRAFSQSMLQFKNRSLSKQRFRGHSNLDSSPQSQAHLSLQPPLQVGRLIPESPTMQHSQRHHLSLSQHRRPLSPPKSKMTTFTDVLTAVIAESSTQGVTLDEVQELWPPDFRAQFSLVRFELSIDCLSSKRLGFDNSGVMQLVTDSMVVGCTTRPGITSIDFSLGELTLSIASQHPSSPYHYILRTEEQTGKSTTSTLPSLASENEGNFISVKLTFCSEAWSKQASLLVFLNDSCSFRATFDRNTGRCCKCTNSSQILFYYNSTSSKEILCRVLQKYCSGASTFLNASFRRYLRIIFQPTPLREFILFWKSGSPIAKTSKLEPVEQPVGTDEPSNIVKQPNVLASREDDHPSTIVHISVTGVSCTCVEDPIASIFALVEFESARVELTLREHGSDFNCNLKNLVITDLSAQDGKHRHLFGVIPGEKYLLSIKTSTTDKLAPFFDGSSLDLEVEIGRVEVLCYIGKLLRIFYWIFDGLLDTLTASPAPVVVKQYDLIPLVLNDHKALQSNGSTESVEQYDYPSSLHKARTAGWMVRSSTHSPTIQHFRHVPLQSEKSDHLFTGRQTVKYGQATEKRFRNEGEKVLARWMMEAAECKAKLGIAECQYLMYRCDYELPEHQRREVPIPSDTASLIPTLTLRRYVIKFIQPSLVIPVSSADPRHARLSVESITISNRPKLSETYGLMDNIQIHLNDVTIQQGNIEAYLLSGVNINVNFFRAALSVIPQTPTWMQFRFSEVPWFMTSDRLTLLLEILYQNVLGDDPDILISRRKNLREELPYTNIQAVGSLVSSPTPSVAVERRPSNKSDRLKYSEAGDKTEIQKFEALKQIQPIRLTSLFQFNLPGLFVFMTPNQKLCSTSSTACFHADLLKCEISKNSIGVLSILVTAKSARLLHCQGEGSSYRVILSDSRQNLSDVYNQELLALRRQVQFHGRTGGFPSDIHTYVERIQPETEYDDVNDHYDIKVENVAAPLSISSVAECQKWHPEDSAAAITKRKISQITSSFWTNIYISDESQSTCVDDLSCLYRSQPGQKDLCVKIYDPRLIVSRSYYNDLVAFFSSEEPKSGSTETLDSTSEPSQDQSKEFPLSLRTTEALGPRSCIDNNESQHIQPEPKHLFTKGEVSTNMRIELANASLIFPRNLNDIVHPLLIMRGTFQAGQTKATTCSEPFNKNIDVVVGDEQEGNRRNNSNSGLELTDQNCNTTSMAHISQSPGILSSPSSPVVEVSPTSLISNVTQSSHYSLSVSQVELFICDLKTLNAVESVEREHLYRMRTSDFASTSSSHHYAISGASSPVAYPIHANGSLSTIKATNLATEPRRLDTTGHSISHTMQDNMYDKLSIQSLINEMALRLPHQTDAAGSSQREALCQSVSSFSHVIKTRPLTIKDLFGLSVTSRSESISFGDGISACNRQECNPQEQPKDLYRYSTHFTMDNTKGQQWEDKIRLLCPNLECILDTTEKSTKEYTWDVLQRSDEDADIEEPSRCIVITIQPINVELSYMDLIFLRQCLNKLNEEPGVVENDINDITTGTSSTTNSPSLTAAGTRKHSEVLAHRPFKTKIDADLAEMKLLLLNDSNEFLSAPFLEVVVRGGSFASLTEGSIDSRRSKMDVSLVMGLRYFNPHAVAFEPVIEQFRVRCVYSKMSVPMSSVTTTESAEPVVSIRDKSVLTITGSRSEPLCINISHILLQSLLRNYKSWSSEFGRLNTAQSVKLTPQETKSDVGARMSQGDREYAPNGISKQGLEPNVTSGMFRFTPYSIRNESGMNLRVSIPVGKDRFSQLNRDRAIDTYETAEQCYKAPEVLRPNESYRLKQLQVDIRSHGQTNFKVELELQDPSSKLFYPFDTSVPVERIGTYLYRAVDLPPPLAKSSAMSSSSTDGSPRVFPTYLTNQYLICHVQVAEGQKQLVVQSQVRIHNILSERLGLEIMVDLPEEIAGCIAERPRLVIPPMMSCCIPAFVCIGGCLSLRPIIWSDSLASQFQPHDSMVFNLEFSSTIKMDDEVKKFSWSKHISLRDLWTRVAVILHEEASSDLEEPADPFLQPMFTSGLPRSLPVETLICHPITSDINGSKDLFYMSVVTEWTNFLHRDRRCQQLSLSIMPPFRIKSTVPIPIMFRVESEYISSVSSFGQHQPGIAVGKHVPTSARATGYLLNQRGSSKDLEVPLPSISEKMFSTSVIECNGDIRLFSLPLLERAALRINPFSKKEAPPPIPIFHRLYPFHSLMNGLDGKQWRRFWMNEGTSSPNTVISKTQMITVTDNEQRMFRIEIILESKPSYPVEVLIHSPVWLVCHIGVGSYLPLECPLAFSYSCHDGEPLPTPDVSEKEMKEKSRHGRTSWVPSFSGKALVARCGLGSLHINSGFQDKSSKSVKRQDLQKRQTSQLEEGDGTKDQTLALKGETSKSLKRCIPASRHLYTKEHQQISIQDIKSTPDMHLLDVPSKNPFAIDCITPWVSPLDCQVSRLRVLCGSFESQDITISEIQGDQKISIQVPVARTKHERQSQLQPSQSAFGLFSAGENENITMRSCDVAVRVSDCPITLPKRVKLITISHRYLLKNDSSLSFKFRQHDTCIEFDLLRGQIVPLEWALATGSPVFELRPIETPEFKEKSKHVDDYNNKKVWEWGGQICPDKIEKGGHFIHHCVSTSSIDTVHFNVRIEKHPPPTSNTPYASIILRIRDDAPDLPDAVQIVNHTPYEISVRQVQSLATRTFVAQPDTTLNFAWDTNLVDDWIYLLPQNPYYQQPALIRLKELPSGSSQIIKFDQTVCRYWFVVIAMRCGSLRLLHVYQYYQAPQWKTEKPLSGPRTPQIPTDYRGGPFWNSPTVKITSPLNDSEIISEFSRDDGMDVATYAAKGPNQPAKTVDWSKLKTLQVFDTTRPHLRDSTLSLMVTLPALFLSVIGDIPRGRIAIEEDSDTATDALRKRNQNEQVKKADQPVPTEFLLLYFEEFKFRYIASLSEDLFGLVISDVQIDNQQPTSTFPVLLQRLGLSSSTTLRRYEARQLLTGVELEVDLEKHPLFDLMVKRRLAPDLSALSGVFSQPSSVASNLSDERIEIMKTLGNVAHVEIARMILLGLIIKADMGLVTSALSIANSYSNSLRLKLESMKSARLPRLTQSSSTPTLNESESGDDVIKTLSNSILTDVSRGEVFIPATIQFKQKESLQKIYFEKCLIHPILLRLSLSPASPVSLSSESTSFIYRFAASIGSIQEVPVSFNAIELNDESKTLSALIASLRSTYSEQLWNQSYVFATGVDLLGNPLTTISHLGAGIGDLVADPVTSFSDANGNGTVLEGIGKGAKSFWDNTVYGAFNVVSKVSGAAAQGLGVLAMDDQYVKERQQQIGRRKPKDASEGFSLGAEALGKAFVGGLKGLVTEPTRAVEERGFEGLMSGVGKGVVGALVKPVAGVFEATALAAGGIQEAAGESSGVARGRRERKRLPRVMYGPDRLMKKYSSIDAMVNDALMFVPGLEWNQHAVDAIFYDEQLQYVSIVNDDELLTANLLPTPRADIYVDLWNIASCNLIAPDDKTVETLLRKPSKIPKSTKNATVKRASRVTTSLIGGLESPRPSTRVRIPSPTYITPSRVCGVVGVLLQLYEPPSTRMIRASTRDLAQVLQRMIQQKLDRLS